MGGPASAMDLGFTQKVIPECHHICLIYDLEDQRRRVVTEYLATGLRQGNFVRYLSDTTAAGDIRGWLAGVGAHLSDAEEQGQFGIVPAEAYYCPEGRFVPLAVLDKMAARLAALKTTEYTGSRICAEMSWALRGVPGADRLLEYESGLNSVNDPYPYVGMCQYDARYFDGGTLFKVLQVHPFMVAQGQVVRNPYYRTPEEFLPRAEHDLR